MDANELARREVLTLHLHYRPDERGPFHRTRDNTPRAHSRLVIGSLRKCASEGTPFGQGTIDEVKASCAQGCHPGQVRTSPARNLCMQAGHGHAFTDDQSNTGDERIWKCCLMQRSQTMCPSYRVWHAGAAGIARWSTLGVWRCHLPHTSRQNPCHSSAI